MGAHLDDSRKYKVRGPDECWWRFQYEEDLKDYRGPRWGWRAYRKMPHGIWLSQGFWSETEVLHRLVVFGRQLNDDDKIDLGLFLYSGGLEAFLTENRIQLGESEKETQT